MQESSAICRTRNYMGSTLEEQKQEVQEEPDLQTEEYRTKHTAIDAELSHNTQALQCAQGQLEILRARSSEQIAQLNRYKQISMGLSAKAPFIREQMAEITELRKTLTRTAASPN
jgi:hypothetical protein